VSHLRVVVWLFVFLFSAQLQANIVAVGLMQGMAILEVEGKRVTLKVGQTRSGVTLIESDSRQALIKYQGKQEVLLLGASIVSSYTQAKRGVVRLGRGENGHYFTSARINGHKVKMLVDTGASHIALSGQMAKRMGINYASGQKGKSSTAGGIVTSYTLKLDQVQVGSIKRYSVLASVIEGAYPSTPLLGMSFLNQIKMHEDQRMLILTD
jgi:aspartyl protease family protein